MATEKSDFEGHVQMKLQYLSLDGGFVDCKSSSGPSAKRWHSNGKKKKQKAVHYLNPFFSCIQLFEFQFCFEAELHAIIVSAGETHLFLQRKSQSLTYQALNHPTYVPWLPTSRLTKQARSSLVT